MIRVLSLGECTAISVGFCFSSSDSKSEILFLLSLRTEFYFKIVLCLAELKYAFVVSEALLSWLKNTS